MKEVLALELAYLAELYAFVRSLCLFFAFLLVAMSTGGMPCCISI